MIVPVMAISNLVLTRQIYSEETNGAHAHYRESVPLKSRKNIADSNIFWELCNQFKGDVGVLKHTRKIVKGIKQIDK